MAFITIAGQNQIAKKQGDNVTLNIASFVLANVPDLGSEPATRIESIPNENVVDQLVVTKSGYVNTNQVVYSLVMGSDIGNYSFNWVGLVDDEGVLIAVTYIPLTPKTKNDGGVPGNTITRNFLLAYTGIQQTTAITVPAETWQIDFSARLSGIDERERLANFDIYGHVGFLGDGWKVTGSAGTYSVAEGIGYVGGIRAKNATVKEITTATFPNEIWLNVSLQGDISDMTAVAEFVIDTGPFPDYVDGNGIEHYLTKIASIASNGAVTDTRTVYETLQMHKNDDDPHSQYRTYADSKSASALSSAENYTDSKAAITLSSAKAYAEDLLSAATPNDVIIPLIKEDRSKVIFSLDGSLLKLNQGISVDIGGVMTSFDAETIVNLPSLVGAADYKVHAHSDGTLTAQEWGGGGDAVRSIGGFHVYHTTEAINQHSLWDLNWRPICSPRAMTLSPCEQIWVDIYLADVEYGLNGYSRPNKVIADGINNRPIVPYKNGGDGVAKYGLLSWFNACELAISAGKRLPFWNEFIGFAFGVVEQQSIGSIVANTGYNAGYRSFCGVEQVTGVRWQWGNDLIGNTGSSWQAITEARGSVQSGGVFPVMLGARWDSTTNAGSRASSFAYGLNSSDTGFCFRAVSKHIIL